MGLLNFLLQTDPVYQAEDIATSNSRDRMIVKISYKSHCYLKLLSPWEKIIILVPSIIFCWRVYSPFCLFWKSLSVNHCSRFYTWKTKYKVYEIVFSYYFERVLLDYFINSYSAFGNNQRSVKVGIIGSLISLWFNSL